LVNNPTFGDLVYYGACIIVSSIIPFVFALTIAVFVWGVVQYIAGAEEEEKRAQGRQFMLWGIIALTVMVSVWGLVKILGATFGIQYLIPQVHV
jgi:hypothetical protein